MQFHVLVVQWWGFGGMVFFSPKDSLAEKILFVRAELLICRPQGKPVYALRIAGFFMEKGRHFLNESHFKREKKNTFTSSNGENTSTQQPSS